ncbi:MAG: phage holin family protein [Deltaproteobacteria bacterium]|nr:phage holin family protein [Deltaproteobacteria bacterium]MBW2415447.1 phage holin family protein [Deltaproteobacteria bacterium]
MSGFLLRLALSAFGLWLAAALLAGVQFAGAGSLFAAALLLGFVNAVVRPLVVLLTLPITLVTLGLFLLVVNGAMLLVVSALLPGFHLADLGSATLAALVVSITSWFGSSQVGGSATRRDVIVVSRRRRP